MKTKFIPGELANLLKLYKASNQSFKNSATLFNKFQPLVVYLASSYPEFWRNDFVQEGNIGLLKAIRNYPSDLNPEKFIAYARKSILRNMIDFYRSTILRKKKYSINEVYENEEIDGADLLSQVTDEEKLVENLDLKIDLEKKLSDAEMTKNDFSQREVEIFNLHFRAGFKLKEVSQAINLSESQTSKIIKKITEKLQLVLLMSEIFNLTNNFKNK